MVILVIGTNNSGKSILAEDLIVNMSADRRKYYIATMIPFGEAGMERIAKHRSMREGKGFDTLEWPTDIDKQLDRLTEEELLGFWGSEALLECISNLVGNEMHSPQNANLTDEQLVNRIVDEVRVLIEAVMDLVIVTNVFPSEDEGYDEDTRRYVLLTDMVNAELIKLAHTVYELKDGVWVKNENN